MSPFSPPLWEGAGGGFLFFLKYHFSVVNCFAHRHAVDVHSADNGFMFKFSIVFNTTFNWLFENVLYQTAGHVVQIDTGINRLGINKLETQSVGERIRIYL